MQGNAYTVGQYLVDRLHQLGVNHLFTVPGDYCAHWIHNYVEPGPIQRIGSTNELNAGYAADGYARVNGIGAVCVTYSVGAFSLLNAVVGAYVEQVPVVVINGAPSVAKRIQYQETGLLWHHMINGHHTDLNIFRNVTVAAECISNAARAPEQIDNALQACLTEQRPIYLETTEDVYDLSCARPEGKITAAPRYSDPDNRKAALEEVLQSLSNASRPLIWAGVELERRGLQDDFRQLVGQLRIPYVTSLAGKSVIAESDPRYMGVFEGPSSPQEVQQLFNDADYVLALGVWLTDINLFGAPLPWERLALAARDAVRSGDSVYPQVTLADLISDPRERGEDFGSHTTLQPPSSKWAEPDYDDKITYQGFFDRMADLLDGSMTVCAGTGLDWFGSSPLPINECSGYIAQSVYGDIGYVTPAALGVSLARGKDCRVVVFAGDGGFQMTAQAISTMSRLGLAPIIFVMDNGVYGIEQWLADPSVFQNQEPFYPLSVLHRWDYSKLCESLGGKGWKVETHGQLEQAFKAALANTTSPSLIQVPLPAKSLPTLAEWKVKA